MVVKTRARAILLPLLFYAVSGAASAFFVWQASIGEHGLDAKAQYEKQMTQLTDQLKTLDSEHKRWARRVSLMRSDAVDRDLLDEEARAVLDRVDKDDLLVFTDPSAPH